MDWLEEPWAHHYRPYQWYALSCLQIGPPPHEVAPPDHPLWGSWCRRTSQLRLKLDWTGTAPHAGIFWPSDFRLATRLGDPHAEVFDALCHLEFNVLELLQEFLTFTSFTQSAPILMWFVLPPKPPLWSFWCPAFPTSPSAPISSSLSWFDGWLST